MHALQPDFNQQMTIMRDPGFFFDVLEKYLQDFGNYNVDREKTLQYYFDTDQQSTASAGTFNMFGQSYQYPQGEHFLVFGLVVWTYDATNDIWHRGIAASLTNLYESGALLNASVNGVIQIRDWLLRNFVSDEKTDFNPGVISSSGPIVLPGQTSMRVTVEVPSAGAAGDLIYIERHGLKLVS